MKQNEWCFKFNIMEKKETESKDEILLACKYKGN